MTGRREAIEGLLQVKDDQLPPLLFAELEDQPFAGQAVRALAAGDLQADAANIAAPTLVAVGAQDVITPPANAHAAFAALPRGLRLTEVPDAGHALPQEAPAAVAALLQDLVGEFA